MAPATPNRAASDSEIRRERGWPRRLVLYLVLFAAPILVMVLSAAERSFGPFGVDGLPTGEAEWIWLPGERHQTVPRAFWVVRDFELPAVPEAAEILIVADESYLLYLNGRRVGSNIYQAGAPLDRYQVAPLLADGANRVAVELRSDRGAGGLLLALVDRDTGEQLLVTDHTWRAFDRTHPGVLQGWLPVEEGIPVLSWGSPPTGRWGRPREAVLRPLFAEVAGLPWGRQRLLPRRLAVGEAILTPEGILAKPGEWRPVEAPGYEEGWPATPAMGPMVLFDWGREVVGYLVLAQDPPDGVGLVYTGIAPPVPRPGSSDAAVVTVPGATLWRDALPRRFRCVTVLGMAALTGAWVEEVDPQRLAELPSPLPARSLGVFGLDPPLLRTPIEDEVRRKLKRLAGGAGGEGL